MNPEAAHHVLASALAVAVPLLGVLQHRRLVGQVHKGVRSARMRAYRTLLAEEWCLALAAFAVLASGAGDLQDSGFRAPSTVRFWIGGAIAAALCGFFIVQAVAVTRNAETLRTARQQFQPLAPLLPHDDREGRMFNLLSVTAGICEETLYRAFLLTYFSAYFDPWIAVPLSSLAFGLGHAYQGVKGVIKTGALGVVLSVLAIGTGSILAPMVLHAVIDLTSGHIARRAFAQDQQDLA